MSWITKFFPSNKGELDEIACLSGTLLSLVDSCFVSTNNLTDCIQMYVPGRKFEKIERDTFKGIPDNCDLIIERLGEMDTYLEEKIKVVEEKMNPDDFKKLVSPGTNNKDRMKAAKLSSTTIIRIAGSMEGVYLCAALKAGNVLGNITRSLGVLKTRAVATIPSGDFGSLWTRLCDMVWSFLTIAPDINQKEHHLNDYRIVVQEFQPAVEGFLDTVSIVKTTIELMA